MCVYMLITQKNFRHDYYTKPNWKVSANIRKMEKMNRLWNSVIKNDNSLIKNFAFTNINILFFLQKEFGFKFISFIIVTINLSKSKIQKVTFLRRKVGVSKIDKYIKVKLKFCNSTFNALSLIWHGDITQLNFSKTNKM